MLTPAHPRPEAREKAAIVVDVQKAQRLRWHRRPDPKVTAQVHVREVVHRLAGQAFVETHPQYVVRAKVVTGFKVLLPIVFQSGGPCALVEVLARMAKAAKSIAIFIVVRCYAHCRLPV